MPSYVPWTYDPDSSFGDENWKELVATLRPGGPGIFSKRKSEVPLVGFIDAKRAEACVRYCTGYSWCDDSTYSLNRVPPVRHPSYANLWCTSVNVQEKYPCGNEENTDNAPYYDSEVDGAFSKYAKYQKAEVLLHFDQIPYDVLADEDTTDESERWTYRFDTKGSLDILSVEGAYFQFAEGPPGPPKPKSIQSSIAVRKETVACVLRWFEVPVTWLSPEGFVPFKLFSYVGKVNSVDMFDGLFPAGTIYLDVESVDYYQLPIRTVGDVKPWVADVAVTLNYFNPPTGIANNPPTSQPLFLGHNLFPYLGDTTSDARWFAGTVGGEPNGPRLIPQADLMQVFTHWAV